MSSFETLPYRPCVGMTVLNRAGLVFVGRRADAPEHVDADHAYEAVAADLAAIVRLFPCAVIVGDDWNWEGVRRAASEHSARTGRSLAALESGWCATAVNT